MCERDIAPLIVGGALLLGLLSRPDPGSNCINSTNNVWFVGGGNFVNMSVGLKESSMAFVFT
jgi:hypothetical protein